MVANTEQDAQDDAEAAALVETLLASEAKELAGVPIQLRKLRKAAAATLRNRCGHIGWAHRVGTSGGQIRYMSAVYSAAQCTVQRSAV